MQLVDELTSRLVENYSATVLIVKFIVYVVCSMQNAINTPEANISAAVMGFLTSLCCDAL